MAYTSINFKTKKQLKDSIASGAKITVYQPGGLFPDPPFPGTCILEGPHYPKPHSWYAQATLDDKGYIIKVK